MDYRKALETGAVLEFPGMKCTLEEEIGRGSNAIVYRGWYPDLLNRNQRHIVLIKELFPFHADQEIRRGEGQEIICDKSAHETWDIHKASFEYGNEAHLRLLERYPDQTGENLNTFSLNGTHYTVLGYTGGRSMEQEFRGPAGNLRRLSQMMIGVLDALEAFHESGLLHLDIAPDNILLVGKPMKERIMLIDYNSVFDMNSEVSASYFSIKEGYSAPEVHKRMMDRFGEPTDLFSVAAVFYRCLSGKALTASEMSSPTPPAVSDCECLRKLPDTVHSMVHSILWRGLRNIPKNRYGSVQEMKEAFQELIDRIDGVGITHWALWEAGRRNVERTIRENPAYAFIREKSSLLPVNAESKEKGIVPADEYISALTEETGHSVLLSASGGMGKTTAMLRAAHRQSGQYSSRLGAIAYVSLHGWKDGQTSFIQNRILETLHFKPETHSYEDAKHIFMQMLDTPIRTRDGDRPVLVILLDGLNEASGDTQALNEEIMELSRKEGVRILVTTRSDEAGLPFERVRLTELTEDDVRTALAEDGLLMPESQEMQELLKTPLMLSIFRQASGAEEKQLSVQTQDELMRAYLDALIRKELSALPDEADERWQIEAAVEYVLPSIAAEIQRRQGIPADRELLSTVERCYRLFSSRILRKAFPEWIGHSVAIRGEAKNAEEWYGEIVHGLLWKRLGLLVRADGGYQIAHQIIGEYLIGLNRENYRKVVRRQFIQRGAMAAAIAAVLVGGAFGYTELIRPQPYNIQLADDALNYGLAGYQQVGMQYDYIRDLLDCVLNTPEDYQDEKWLYDNNTEMLMLLGEIMADANICAEEMFKTGKVMPGSNIPMDQARYSRLVSLYTERSEEYAEFLNVVDYLMNNEWAYRLYAEEYLGKLDELIELDARIAASLYQIVCMQHVNEMYEYNSPEAVSFEKVFSAYSRMNAHMDEMKGIRDIQNVLNQYQAERDVLREELSTHSAAGKLEW